LQEEERHIKALRHLPTALGAVLALEPSIIAWAGRFAAEYNGPSFNAEMNVVKNAIERQGADLLLNFFCYPENLILRETAG